MDDLRCLPKDFHPIKVSESKQEKKGGKHFSSGEFSMTWLNIPSTALGERGFLFPIEHEIKKKGNIFRRGYLNTI